MKLILNRNKSPNYEIRLNNQIVDKEPLINKLSKFEQTHVYNLEYTNFTSLEVKLLNKDPSDSIIENNKIIEDVAVVITGFNAEGIDLTQKIGKIFVYTDLQNNQHITHGFMHVNGSMLFTVNTNILYTDWISSF